MQRRQTESTLPAYKNLASFQGFNIRRVDNNLRQKAYPGMAVGSRDTLYFVVDVKSVFANTPALGGAAGGAAAAGLAGGALAGPLGGLIGGMVGGILGELFDAGGPQTVLRVPVAGVRECPLADLPREVADHPDWPVPWEEGPVLVVPRRAVLKVRTSFWVGGIDIHLDAVIVRIFTPVFRRKQMASHLAELGWTVEGGTNR
jgi:hypothetical protein